MRRKKSFGFAVFLSVLLVVAFVLGPRLLNAVNLLLLSNTRSYSSSSSGPSLIVDPAVVIDSRLQATNSSKFSVSLNVSSVTDLFTWQVNITWKPTMLSFSKVVEYGPFLRATSSPNGTTGWINRNPTENVTVVAVNNAAGCAGIAESILDSRVGATGVSGSGRLVTIEFLVTGYGSTDLNFSLVGGLGSTLLNSLGGKIDLPIANLQNGYFRNTIAGDAQPDGEVNIGDLVRVKYCWYPGPPLGPGGYDRDADQKYDGDINIADLVVVKSNWGNSI